MLVALPMVTIEPPDSTNFLSCGKVLSSVTLPIQLLYSSGGGSTAPRPPKPPPPPPPPPRPPKPPGPRMAPETNTSTSNLLLMSPASSADGYTVWNGISYCSKRNRVQPAGISPPY